MQTALTVILCILIVVVNGHQKINPSQCGVRQIKHNKVIVRGEETTAGDFPWHAAVFHKERRSNSYQCGGTLISDHFVVTAEHCVITENGFQMLPENIFVRLGLLVWHSINENTQQHEISRIIGYEGAALRGERRHDIALLKLNSIVKMTAYVQPACLNEMENIAGLIGTAVGWGFTEDDQLSEKLQSARLQIRTTDECIESNHEVFGPTWHNGVFCAGWNNGTSACNGDSGGGLFIQRENVSYLSGIVAFTETREDKNSCKPTGYTAFTKITKYLSWIQNNTNLQFNEPQFESSLFPSDCGLYRVNRVGRGQKANLFEFPWMALIYQKKEQKFYYRTGTLITKRYVLSKAAVIGTNIKVILGEHTLKQEKDCNPHDATDCAPPIEEYDIGREDITVHELQNTIALIRLGRDVIFKDHIKPVCLPTTSALSQLSLPQYIVTGWGKDEHGNMHYDLRKATVRAIDYDVCKAAYISLNSSYKFTEQEFCAQGTANGALTCDYMGPVGYMAQHDAGLRFVQFGFGLFSRRECHAPSVFLKLASYVGWIAANIKP